MHVILHNNVKRIINENKPINFIKMSNIIKLNKL